MCFLRARDSGVSQDIRAGNSSRLIRCSRAALLSEIASLNYYPLQTLRVVCDLEIHRAWSSCKVTPGCAW